MTKKILIPGDLISETPLKMRETIVQEGRHLGTVKAVIVDVQEGEVSHLLLIDFDAMKREEDMREVLKKSSVLFKRVKTVGESIIVSSREE